VPEDGRDSQFIGGIDSLGGNGGGVDFEG
jgi:hypothetical protein